LRSPGGSSSQKIARECGHYVASQFFPTVTRGKQHQGYRCEDLEAQTFADEAFDLVISDIRTAIEGTDAIEGLAGQTTHSA